MFVGSLGNVVLDVVDVQLCDERRQESVETGAIAVVASVKVGAQHQDDLHEGDATDPADISKLRQETDLKRRFRK